MASALRQLVFWATVFVTVPDTTGRELAKLQYDSSTSHITVKMKVADELCDVMIDTGSTRSLLDVSFRDKLGPVLGRSPTRTSFGYLNIDLYSSPQFELGALRVRCDRAVGCVSLVNYQTRPGKRISGVLGMDILRQFVVQIDPDEQTIAFLDKTSVPTEQWGKEVQLGLSDAQIPSVMVRVNDLKPIPFLIDLGDGSTGSIGYADYKTLVAADTNAVTVVGYRWSAGLANSAKAVSFRVNSLSVECFEHSKLVFSVGVQSRLGLDYFMRYTTTFDFPNAKLYLAPGNKFHDYDYSDFDGMVIFANLIDNKGYLIGVFDQSVAAQVGIRNRDLLLDVDGRVASELEAISLARYLKSTTDRDISITVERQGQRLQFTLPRGRRIGRINDEEK